jgi:hypothetical protein
VAPEIVPFPAQLGFSASPSTNSTEIVGFNGANSTTTSTLSSPTNGALTTLNNAATNTVSNGGEKIEIARCKNLLKIASTSPQEAHVLFDQHVLSFQEFQQIFSGDANALYDNDIVFRINGVYVSFFRNVRPTCTALFILFIYWFIYLFLYLIYLFIIC